MLWRVKAARTVRRSLVAVALCVGAGSACAGRSGVVVRVAEFPDGASAGSWTGHHRDELVAVWGQPSATLPDGKGGTILHYDRIRLVSPDARQEWVGYPPGRNEPVQLIDPHRPRIELAFPIASFWVDGAGAVYRYEIRPKAIDKKLRRSLLTPPRDP